MNVLLFGILAEQAGTDMLDVEATTTYGLRRILAKHIPGLEQMSYALAVDRVLVHDDRALDGTEEIALLPPFAGG